MAKKRVGAAPLKAAKVPVDRRLVLLTVVFAVASAVLAALLVYPQFSSLTQGRSELARLEAQAEDLSRRLVEAAGSGDAQLEQMYRTVQQLEEAIPSSPSRERLTVEVVQLAESIGVQVQRLDPTGEDQQVTDTGRHQFSVRFVGSYSALLTLLDRLEQFPALSTLSSVQLAAQGDLYTLSGTLSFWFIRAERLTDALPRQSMEAPGAGELEGATSEPVFENEGDGEAEDESGNADVSAGGGEGEAGSGSASSPAP